MRIFKKAVSGGAGAQSAPAAEQLIREPSAVLTAGPKAFVDDAIYCSLAFPSLHTFRETL
jgi:hypothetical protein